MYSIMLRNGGVRELVLDNTLVATFDSEYQLIQYLLDTLNESRVDMERCSDYDELQDEIDELEGEIEDLENQIRELEENCG